MKLGVKTDEPYAIRKVGEGEGLRICKDLKPHPARVSLRLSRADLSQREKYQNSSFSANWICRAGVAVLVISPAESL